MKIQANVIRIAAVAFLLASAHVGVANAGGVVSVKNTARVGAPKPTVPPSEAERKEAFRIEAAPLMKSKKHHM